MSNKPPSQTYYLRIFGFFLTIEVTEEMVLFSK